MDLNYTDEEKAFRDEVRRFLAEKLPARLADKVKQGKTLTKQDHEEWHAILNEKGWLAGNWPKKFGGAGWDVAPHRASYPSVWPCSGRSCKNSARRSSRSTICRAF